jgi:hypothetical protein
MTKTQEAMAIFLNEPTKYQKSSEFEKRAEKMRVVLEREKTSWVFEGESTSCNTYLHIPSRGKAQDAISI